MNEKMDDIGFGDLRAALIEHEQERARRVVDVCPQEGLPIEGRRQLAELLSLHYPDRGVLLDLEQDKDLVLLDWYINYEQSSGRIYSAAAVVLHKDVVKHGDRRNATIEIMYPVSRYEGQDIDPYLVQLFQKILLYADGVVSSRVLQEGLYGSGLDLEILRDRPALVFSIYQELARGVSFPLNLQNAFITALEGCDRWIAHDRGLSDFLCGHEFLTTISYRAVGTVSSSSIIEIGVCLEQIGSVGDLSIPVIFSIGEKIVDFSAPEALYFLRSRLEALSIDPYATVQQGKLNRLVVHVPPSVALEYRDVWDVGTNPSGSRLFRSVKFCLERSEKEESCDW